MTNPFTASAARAVEQQDKIVSASKARRAHREVYPYQLNVRITRDMHMKLHMRALHDDISVTEFVRRTLAAALREQPAVAGDADETTRQ